MTRFWRPKKDVASYVMPWRVASRLRTKDFLMGLPIRSVRIGNAGN